MKPKEPNAPAKGQQLEKFLIPPMQSKLLQVFIICESPLVMNKISKKTLEDLEISQRAGDASKIRKARAPKDFTALFNGARHISPAGWDGFPCAMMRNACISACRTVGYHMTKAKLALWVVPDGFSEEGNPLVRIYDEAEEVHHYVKNANGVIDIRSRPMYRQWWAAPVMKFDSGMMQASDVMNLVMRVGAQVGLGAGRNDSSNSAGCGWGAFRIATEEEERDLRKKMTADRTRRISAAARRRA